MSYGKTLLEAFQKMETLEHLAQVNLVAHQLGSPQPLSSRQVSELQEARNRYCLNTAVAPAERSLPEPVSGLARVVCA